MGFFGNLIGDMFEPTEANVGERDWVDGYHAGEAAAHYHDNAATGEGIDWTDHGSNAAWDTGDHGSFASPGFGSTED